MKTPFLHSESGLSIIEILTVLLIISIVSASVIDNIKEINRPLTNTGFEITHYLRLARARAISQTQFIKIHPSSNFQLVSASGESCETASNSISNLTLNLSNDTSLISNSWEICFTPRGLSNTSYSFQIRDELSHTRDVQIALGGGVRVQ